MQIRLSPRLRRAADFVPRGSVAVDVGTDHAYLPIWLLQTGVSPRAYATDNKPGPLENARRDAAAAGVASRLTLWLCDGLALCPPEAVDTVVLAGMGGETIIGILSRSPWALDKRLVLQPQTKPVELRAWLAEQNCRVADAALVYDTGRIYQVWLAERGAEDAPQGVIVPALLEKRDPLLRAFSAELVKRTRKQLSGLERAAAPDAAALGRARAELEELEQAYREALTWQP